MDKKFLLLFLVFFSGSVSAASFDPGLFAELRWRLIGPFRGGRVLAVSGVAGQPNHFYFGAVNGGVWETNDAGRTWQPIFDAMPIASIGALAVAPSNPAILYVGSGEADMRSDIGYGNGMYKSVDGGKSWTHIGLENTHQIGRILVDPKNANRIFVAALGHGYGANPERGVFRSEDGGSTWQKILYKNPDTGAIDLCFGADSKTIYAALWQTRRPPWNVYPPSKGPSTGLYKSTDGGDHWAQISGHGFPDEEVGRIGVTVARSDPQIVYALIDSKAGGVYRSDDSGKNWKHLNDQKRLWQRGWYFGGITVDPKNPQIVFVSNTTMYKSTNGGKTFLPFRGAPGGDDYHELWIDPEDSNRMISGVDQGAIITLNGGKTWSSWYNQPIAQIYHVNTDNAFPYNVYGTQQDSGAAMVPSRTDSAYDGINMMQFHEITAGDENGYISPDPLDPKIIYGGTVQKLDRNTGQTTTVDPTLAYPDIYRSEWTLPLTFSPRNPRSLYFANQYLFRTDDGGKHWALLSGDLTRKELVVPPNLDPITAKDTLSLGSRRAVIYAIAPSPVRDHMIWIGTDDGLVWITEDEGSHWSNITPQAVIPWSKIGIIDASHFDPDTAYIAVDRHRVDDYKPYIYRTHDRGKTWNLITAGIPTGHFVNVVREDPKKKGLLYAGTELSMYVSLDDGDHWQSLQLNLPVTSVRDINVHEDDLVIGTHGRGFWILDNVTPLRQITSELITGEAYLFEPARAYRIHPSPFAGTPLPKDEPIAENQPFGAPLDYYLSRDVENPVTLEILDREGKIVRRYSSDDKPPGPNIEIVVVTSNWFEQPQTLSRKAGLHRFVWDLHYTFPEALRETESKDGSQPKGKWALPGEYSIRLTVNGHPYTQHLNVKNDPRVNISQTELSRQFEFASQIEAGRIRLTAAKKDVEDLLKRADALRLKGSQDLATMILSFENAIAELTEIRVVSPDPGSPGSEPAKTTSFLYLDSALKRLQQTVDASDVAPSVDATTGFEKQRSAVQIAVRQWETFKTEWLPKLNQILQAENFSPLE